MIRSRRHLRENSQHGQIVVEYILLLVVGVSVALLITSLMVSRSDDPEDQGFLIRKWRQIIEVIATDRPDDVGSAPANN